MAKEPATTRIPICGTSRIPIPGTGIRPPSTLKLSSLQTTIKPTQLLRPPSNGVFVKQRPTSFAGLRPSGPLNGDLKKSSSGDRINSAVNFMGKKTTSALKKIFGKSDKNPNEATPVKNPSLIKASTISSENNNKKDDTPNPLTRSDTFVRSDSQDNIMGLEEEDLDATPVPSKRIMPPQESKQLLTTTRPRGLFYSNTNKSFDTPAIKQQLGQTITLNERTPFYKIARPYITPGGKGQLGKTMSLDEHTRLLNNTKTLSKEETQNNFGKTYDKLEATQIKTHNNLTLTTNSSNVFGQTKCLTSPTTMNQKSFDDKTVTVEANDLTKTLEGAQFLDRLTANDLKQTFIRSEMKEDHLDLASPATNATFSNPGSSDNLMLLEDVSVPSGLEAAGLASPNLNLTQDAMDVTLMVLAPDKANMKLPLNSTLNECLVDISGMNPTPARHIQLLNLTKDYIDSPRNKTTKNTSHLLYMTQMASTMTPDRNTKALIQHQHQMGKTPNLLSPLLMKGAQSDLALPIRTPDEEMLYEPMDVDITLTTVGARTEQFYAQNQEKTIGSDCGQSLQDINDPQSNKQQKGRFSFGFDLTESTLDCSIELVDVSLSSTVLSQPNASFLQNSAMSHSNSQHQLQQQLFKKQNSFEMDESLGILTPDQMKEFLDSTTTNNTNNLELPLVPSHANTSNHKHSMQQMRADQTPSPEELPLDPVEVRTDICDMVLMHQQQLQYSQQNLQMQQSQQETDRESQQDPESENQQSSRNLQSATSLEPVSTATDTEISKTDHMSMSKSTVSKISTSFITSVTSVTSLDTGYQGDGEMSRPASRGASDHSPSNSPNARKGVSRQPSFNQQHQHLHNLPPIRRQDPMADSDFFTESDADDVLHRGDRRAQVIDGHLYGPALQSAASVFITEDPQMEDSCMESSGIFTDVENRCDEDLVEMRRRDCNNDPLDMSPEGDDSAKTVKSNAGELFATGGKLNSSSSSGAIGQGHLTSNNSGPHSTTSSTIQSSLSTDRLSSATTLSNRTSYCSVDGNSVVVDCKSFASLEEAFVVSSSLQQQQSQAPHQTATATAIAATESSPRSLKRPKSSVIESTTSKQKHFDLVPQTCSPRKHASLTSLSLKQNSTNSSISGNHIKNHNHNNSQSQNHSHSHSHSYSNGKINQNKKSNDGGVIYCNNNASATKSVNNETSPRLINRKKNLNRSSSTSPPTPVSSCESIKTKSGDSFCSSLSASGKKNSNSSPPPTAATVNRLKCSSVIPNKWDAVMNKIAENKASIAKRNYNDVKSKVSSTRLQSVVSAKNLKEVSQNPKSLSAPKRIPLASVNKNENSSTIARQSSNNPPSSATSPRLLSVSKKSSQLRVNVNVPVNGSNGRDSNSSSPLQKEPLDTGLINDVPPGQPKRNPLSAARRGRSYSKDSQKSSQSDLSHTSGSPKLLAKTPIRAAKKRDVRNLSISPTDLGPPPKAHQTANGTSIRNKQQPINLTQNRNNASTSFARSSSLTPSSISTSTTSSSPIGRRAKDGSTSSKKFSLTAKRLDIKSSTGSIKSPLKETNRVLNPTNSSISLQSSKSSTKSEALTELEELSGVINYNLNNNNNDLASSEKDIIDPTTPKSTTQEELPALAESPKLKEYKSSEKNFIDLTTPKRTTSEELTSLTKSTKLKNNVPQKLPATKSSASCKLFSPKQKLSPSTSQICEAKNETPSSAVETADNTATSATTMDYINAIDQQFAMVNSVSNESQTRQEKFDEAMKLVQTKDVEAIGDLIQYLVYELDAYSCPALKLENTKTKESLTKTLQLLDEAKSACSELQDQLSDKEAYFNKREQELQALHLSELEKAQEALQQNQQLSEARIADLEKQLQEQNEKHAIDFECYKQELEKKYALKLQKLSEAEEREKKMQERIQELEVNDVELRQQLTQTEILCANRIQKITEHENQLEEQVKVLNKELEILQHEKESQVKEYKDKFEELALLRSSKKPSERQKSPRHSTPPSSTMNSSTSSQHQMEVERLENEIQSLQYVVELKQDEITRLKKQTEQLTQEQEDRSALQCKTATLESKLEMLSSDMERKTDKEKSLLLQIEDLQKTIGHETTKRSRLSYQNEELQWKLKKFSEKVHFLEQALSSSHNSCSCCSQRSNFFSESFLENSMPSDPVVKGLIEKSESVSYTLEMDDETPETAARKVVMRAGSFRGGERPNAPPPLAQSMSATNVDYKNLERDGGGSLTSMRTRSKSVSQECSMPDLNEVKSSKRFPMKSNRGSKTIISVTPCASSSNIDDAEVSFVQSLNHVSTSSPASASCSKLMRPRSSTMNGKSSSEVNKRRSSASLSTCDGYALNTSAVATAADNNDMFQQNLVNCGKGKSLKSLKIQQIQESAGEAMVSGANSEDESCSGCSDEMTRSSMSAASSNKGAVKGNNEAPADDSESSGTSCSSSPSHQAREAARSALEEVLLLEELDGNSLPVTPMDVSWCEDNDDNLENGGSLA